MSEGSKLLRCVVVTPEQTVLDAEADFVALPAYDGEVGVMLHHTPLVARLAPGELRLTVQGLKRRFFVDGGFGQVRDNVVTVLTPRAVAGDEIDVDATRQELQSAREESAALDDAMSARQLKIDRARAQLRVAGG